MENWCGLVFLSGSERFALNADSIDRVAHVPALANIPGAPPFHAGFFYYLEHPIALLRFDQLMGLDEREPGFYAPMIILKTEPVIALLVEEIACFIKLDPDALTTLAPERSFNGCAGAQFQLDGNPVTVLSCEKLLLRQEREAIAAMTANEHARLAALAQEVADACY